MNSGSGFCGGCETCQRCCLCSTSHYSVLVWQLWFLLYLFWFTWELILIKWKEMERGSNSERLINCRCNMMSWCYLESMSHYSVFVWQLWFLLCLTLICFENLDDRQLWQEMRIVRVEFVEGPGHVKDVVYAVWVTIRSWYGSRDFVCICFDLLKN